MPEFEYTARAADGRIEKGMMIAQGVPDLQEKLRARDLILTASSVGKNPAKRSWLERFQTVPMVQKMFFTKYLQVLIHAGFSIARALDALGQQSTHKYFRKVIGEIRADVESGMSFSKSLSKHPRVFGELYINMIAAGESSGKLDDVLGRLSMKMKKDHTLLAKVKGALTYPIIIIITMIAVAILMTVVVIPKLAEIFEESQASLPLATKVLVTTSKFLLANGVLTVVVVLVLLVLFIRGVRTKNGKRFFDAALLRGPVIGPIIKKVNLARFTRSLSSLLETNIPIIETFLIISRTMGNSFYRSALEEAGNKLRTGSTIAKILDRYPKLFPPVTTQMIAIGEESGSLDTIAGELAQFYEEEVDQTMSNLSSIIEPVLMLILGVGVALLAVAVILPIYSLSQTLG